jgi:hypothetical protein
MTGTFWAILPPVIARICLQVHSFAKLSLAGLIINPPFIHAFSFYPYFMILIDAFQ